MLSNDSFQEFHGEHEWLFDKGRLIGGKPVPGIGWIFTPRTPVRGPKSREAVKVAKRQKKASVAGDLGFGSLEEEVAARRAGGGRPPRRGGAGAAGAGAGAGAASEGAAAPASAASGSAKKAGRAPKKAAKVEKAIALATDEVVAPDEAGTGRRRRRGRGGTPPSEPVNAPLAFIEFVSQHPLGSLVDGVVDRFSSHGAFVIVGDAVCYVPLSAMGDPPPRAAREVLSRGETRPFAVQALDPPRRGIELALPEFTHVAATVTDETVEEEIAAGHVEPVKKAAGRGRKKAAAPVAEAAPKRSAAAKKKKAAEVTAAEAKETAEADDQAKAQELAAAPLPAKKSAAKKAGSRAVAGRDAETAAAAKRAGSRAGRDADTAAVAKKAGSRAGRHADTAAVADPAASGADTLAGVRKRAAKDGGEG